MSEKKTTESREELFDRLLVKACDALSREELLDRLLVKACDALHDIAGVYFARRKLAEGNVGNQVMREVIQKKALTDEQIERLALDTWEEIAIARNQRGGDDG